MISLLLCRQDHLLLHCIVGIEIDSTLWWWYWICLIEHCFLTELFIFTVLASKGRWNVSPATISLMGPAPIGKCSTRYVCCVTVCSSYSMWKLQYEGSKTGFSSFPFLKLNVSVHTASSHMLIVLLLDVPILVNMVVMEHHEKKEYSSKRLKMWSNVTSLDVKHKSAYE